MHTRIHSQTSIYVNHYVSSVTRSVVAPPCGWSCELLNGLCHSNYITVLLLMSHTSWLTWHSWEEVRTRHASVNEDWKQQDWDVFGSFQVAAHRGRDQGAPPLQQTALQRRHVLGQLRWGAASVALLQSQGRVDRRRLLPLPVPERCHAVSIRHQPGLYLVSALQPQSLTSSSVFRY